MTGRQAPNAYQEMQVLGSDSRKLVVLLCQALKRYMLRAKSAIESCDYEAKAQALIHANQVLSELICSLDLEAGGEMAENLRDLYVHLQRQLVDVDLQDDIHRLNHVIEITQKLADAWEEAAQKCAQDQATEKAA